MVDLKRLKFKISALWESLAKQFAFSLITSLAFQLLRATRSHWSKTSFWAMNFQRGPLPGPSRNFWTGKRKISPLLLFRPHWWRAAKKHLQYCGMVILNRLDPTLCAKCRVTWFGRGTEDTVQLEKEWIPWWANFTNRQYGPFFPTWGRKCNDLTIPCDAQILGKIDLGVAFINLCIKMYCFFDAELRRYESQRMMKSMSATKALQILDLGENWRGVMKESTTVKMSDRSLGEWANTPVLSTTNCSGNIPM